MANIGRYGGDPTTKEQAINKLLDLARAEIGYHEGANNWNKFAQDLEKFPDIFWGGSKQNLAWCCVFVVDMFYKLTNNINTAINMLYAPRPSGLAACSYAAEYYRQAGKWTTKAAPGNQIFFGPIGSETHTGIVESVSGSTVTTIEGNTSDGVYRRQYAVLSSNIAGYGIPDWSLVVDEPAPIPTPEPTPQPTTYYTLTFPVIKEGDSGEFVKAIQILLIAHGLYCGGRIINKKEIPDGEFGPSTKVGVMTFQLSCGLAKNGIVSKETLTHLLGMA